MANTQVFQVFRVLGALLIFWSKGGIPYNNRESPYLHIVFYMISFFFYNFNIHFQDVLKNIDSLIIFSPHFQVYNFRPLLITSKIVTTSTSLAVENDNGALPSHKL